MNHRDTPIGAVLLLLAVVVLWHVRSYPPSPGQPYNAALFPGIAAAALAIAAVLLMAQGLRRRRVAQREAADEKRRADADRARTDGIGADAGTDAGTDGMEVLPTADVPSRLLAILLTAGAIVFYLVLANVLGFVLTGILLLAILMWAYGVRPTVFVPVSIIATLLIHTSFYKLLKVPLPWGILQPIAW